MRLEITTHIGCPIDCLDCPQALLLSRYTGKRDLDYDDYKRVIDKVPEGCRIDFSGMCEPFANDRCTDMIIYAYERGYPLALYTTLQGATLDDIDRLRGVRFEVVTIHLPDADGRSHFNITDDYLRLLDEVIPDNYSVHGQLDPRVVPHIKQRNMITYMHDRAGNVECRDHITIDTTREIYCATSWRGMDHNVLLPDGTVLVCCMDYGMTGIFGNLFTQTYDEVLHSPEAERLRKTLKSGESICRHCANARLI